MHVKIMLRNFCLNFVQNRKRLSSPVIAYCAFVWFSCKTKSAELKLPGYKS